MSFHHKRTEVASVAIALAASASLTVVHADTGAVRTLTQASPASAQETRETQQPPSKQSASTAVSVDLREFEDNPQRYIGQTVTLRGEVGEVVGPRLFTIDEASWIDLDSETLVLVPAPFAAMIRSDEPVTVTGKVQPFVQADVEREWGWFGRSSGVEVDLKNRPVIVARDVATTSGTNALLSLSRSQPPTGDSSGTSAPVGTTGSSAGTKGSPGKEPLTDVAKLAGVSDTSLVGRQVSLTGIRVADTAERGFWVDQNGQGLFVLQPDDGDSRKVSAGQTVSIEGVVLQFPKQMKRKLGERAHNEPVYVQAQSIS